MKFNIKHYLTALTGISACLLMSPVYASDADECTLWQSKATQFMTARQQGVPIAQAVKSAQGNRSRGLLLNAYSVDIAETEQGKAEAITSFTMDIEKQCLAEHAAK